MLSIKIAFRFIFRKPVQYFFVLLVTIFGVAIFYFIYNVSDGLKRVALNSTAEAASYISIKGEFAFSSYDDEDIKNFRSDIYNKDGRVNTISYSLSVPGEINRLWINTKSPVIVKGLNFKENGQIQGLSSRIGRLNIPKTLDEDDDFFGEVAIGWRLSTLLGYSDPELAIGKPLKIALIINNVPTDFIFRISSVFFSEFIELTEKMAFTTIETLHKINEFANRANLIEMRTNNPLNADDVVYKIQDVVEDYYGDLTIHNWQEGNKYIVNALYIENVSLALIQVFSALAIAFGLASILVFTVREKISQIGVLKALGLSNQKLRGVFWVQSLFILILSIVIGLYLGNSLSLFFVNNFRRINTNAPLVPLTLGLNNNFAKITIITISISSVIAVYLPIRIANRLRIIDVIKKD